MKPNTIITISRQYGSQGHKVGEALAQRLGISFYDREIVARASEKSGFGEELFNKLDRRGSNSFIYSLSMFGTTGMNGLSLNDQLFISERDIIREMAKQGSGVFVGRCADYILRKQPNIFNFFIKAPLEKRIQNVIDENPDVLPTKESVLKLDKQRATYYNYYTGQRWGDAANYDLCLDSSRLGIEKCCDIIMDYIETVQAEE